NRCVPVPAHAAVVPHWHVRSTQPFDESASQPPWVHAEHRAVLVCTQPATPAFSQQSWLPLQPRESPGSHSPHWPCWVPFRTHTGLPPALRMQRRSVTSAIGDVVPHETQALFTQKGAFGFEQSLSTTQTAQRPLVRSQTGVSERFAQWASLLHGWHE